MGDGDVHGATVVRPIGRVGVRLIALAAVLVAVVGLRQVWMTPSAAIDLLEPALLEAEVEAARTGDPVVRWDVDDDGRPDPDAPLLVALATLPDDVRVEVRPRLGVETWRRGALLEVSRDGHLDRACLRLTRPPEATLRWELSGYRVPLRWPIGSGCRNPAAGAPALVVVEAGRIEAAPAPPPAPPRSEASERLAELDALPGWGGGR